MKIFKIILVANLFSWGLIPVCATVLGADFYHSGDQLGQLQSLTYPQVKAGVSAVPLQITQLQVEAPVRRIDLVSGSSSPVNVSVVS